MSLEATILLDIEGVSDPLRVTRLVGQERIHAPFRIELTILARPHGETPLSLDAEQLLGAAVAITFQDDPAREVHGVVEALHAEAEGYRIVIVSAVAELADVVDYRVFLDQDAVAITKALLSDRGIEVEERLTRAPDKRAQCVQAWEPSLDFMARILSEEGISWCADTTDGTPKVILTDSPSGAAPIEGDDHLPFGAGEAAGLDGRPSVYALELRRRASNDRVTLSDFDFEKPTVALPASSGDGPLEHYEPLAGTKNARTVAELAKVRLGERTRERLTLGGRSTCKRLAPGCTFVLDGAPHPAQNGTWLVVAVTHDARDFGAASGGPSHEITFTAVPADTAYRPPRTRAPMPGGLQMGTVTGPAGSEIHTEGHGRVKAKLRWDRRGAEDDSASTWIRPVQPPLSGGFFLPRVGWEVLFGFGRTAADEPYLLGRLDNGVHTPAESLPAQKVRSAFGSRTTPGGGSQNLLRMDDAAGVEGFAINASKDLNERTENDKGTTVAGNETVKVGGNHKEIVGVQQTVAVAGAQALSVGGDRSMTTTGQLAIVSASESVSVGGTRKFQVGGDLSITCASLNRSVGAAKAEVAIEEQNRHVTGAHTVVIGGAWAEPAGLVSAVSVLGASTLNVAGAYSVQTANYSMSGSSLTETYGAKTETAGGARIFAAKGALSLHVGAALSMKGSIAVFEADSITISAGGITIKLGGSHITIDGKLDTSGGSLVTGDEKHD